MTRSISRTFVAATLLLLILTAAVAAQRVAVLSPESSGRSDAFNLTLINALAREIKMIDPALALGAFRSQTIATPYNMTTAEARAAGAVMGSDLFILTDVRTQRRSSFELKQHYEASAAIYVVSSRTGELVHWAIPRRTAATESDADRDLADTVTELAPELIKTLTAAYHSDLELRAQTTHPPFPTEAEESDPGYRSPIPYNRIKPEYTALADLFGIRATVDIVVDIDAEGNVLRTSIERWAGYGLDESVEKAIRTMNWRPAERNGTKLAKRVLLRYNFTKVDPDDQR